MVQNTKSGNRKILWPAAAAATLLAASTALYADAHVNHAKPNQEKEAPSRQAATDYATTLNDQTDLSVTVYNSNIALVRDVRNLLLPTGTFRLKLEDIAATV